MAANPWLLTARALSARCLHLRLRPYSLGHEILLESIDSAFHLGRSEDEQVPEKTFEELVLAVLICSQNFANGKSFLESRWLTIWVRLWKFLFLRKIGPIELRAEIDFFQTYQAEGCWMPDINSPLKGREMPSPWSLRLLTWFMAELRMSEIEVLDAPLQWLTALRCARLDYTGEISLFGKELDGLFDPELEAKIAAEEAKGEAGWQ